MCSVSSHKGVPKPKGRNPSDRLNLLVACLTADPEWGLGSSYSAVYHPPIPMTLARSAHITSQTGYSKVKIPILVPILDSKF